MCPTEICGHGFKVKISNVVSYVFFPRDPWELWFRHEVVVAVNAIALGDFMREMRVRRWRAFAHDYNYGLWEPGYQGMRK